MKTIFSHSVEIIIGTYYMNSLRKQWNELTAGGVDPIVEFYDKNEGYVRASEIQPDFTRRVLRLDSGKFKFNLDSEKNMEENIAMAVNEFLKSNGYEKL
mgnify:CR=1 FL=1